MPDYLKLAQDAYEASTSYVDANYRQDWDYSLRAFRNEHAPGSKYLSEEFRSRSRIFPPKTRSIIRKNEAAAMQAHFSNREMVSCEPVNPNDVMSVATASALKEILTYRLSRTIPTFETYIGGVQDAQTTGAVASYQYWEYERKADGTVVKDRPCIDLRPVENLRFDAGASWIDPVNTSPYFCDIVPMYVCDVKSMMQTLDDKTGKPKWKKLDDSQIMLARPDAMDSTRKARLGNKEDPQDQSNSISSFDIVWVMRWFMREAGEDVVYYTMGTEAMLSEVKPISEVYFHGVRPYAMGYAVLETHKAVKSSMPVLIRPLQQESADIRNQRLDNVKFVLNKRWIVARGRQVDVQSLVRNVPGGVTMATDPRLDVQESNWPDVTSSSFVEHDRLNAETDDLAGNFSPSTRVANNAVNDTLGGSRLASAGAGLMTEYLLHTINTTWWTKVVRQLALLEQYYETNEVVLAVCAEKAQLFPRFGISRITDMMLTNEVIVNVDMAMGEPTQRLQKFLAATNAAIQLRLNPAPGANINEMTKEIYSNAGYRDGARFFNEQQDPQLMKAMQMIQQLQGMVKGKQMELQSSLQETQMRLQSDQQIKGAQLQVDQARISGDLQIRQSELAIEAQKLELEREKLRLEAVRVEMDATGSTQDLQLRAAEIQPRIEEAQIKLAAEQQKLEALKVKTAADAEKSRNELAESAMAVQAAQMQHEAASMQHMAAKNQIEVEPKRNEQLNSIITTVEKLAKAVADAHGGVNDVRMNVDQINKGLGALAGVVLTPKRKPTGMKLNKKDGRKTDSVTVVYDDGSNEEIGVG